MNRVSDPRSPQLLLIDPSVWGQTHTDSGGKDHVAQELIAVSTHAGCSLEVLQPHVAASGPKPEGGLQPQS